MIAKPFECRHCGHSNTAWWFPSQQELVVDFKCTKCFQFLQTPEEKYPDEDPRIIRERYSRHHDLSYGKFPT